MGQNNISLIQILFVIAFLALSGLGWVIRKAQEQAEKKKSQAERQRRLEEMLRTGRDPMAEQATAMAQASAGDRARIEELARRRQAQMEQLRREHAQRRQEGQRSGKREADIPPIIVMGPSGPITLPRAGQQGSGRPAGTPYPRPAPSTKPAPARQQQRPARPQAKPQRKPERAEERPIAPPPKPQPERRETPVASAARPGVLPGGRTGRRGMIALPTVNAGLGGPGGSARAAEYRRLVAMMEAMRPPLAIREQEEPGPVYRAF